MRKLIKTDISVLHTFISENVFTTSFFIPFFLGLIIGMFYISSAFAGGSVVYDDNGATLSGNIYLGPQSTLIFPDGSAMGSASSLVGPSGVPGPSGPAGASLFLSYSSHHLHKADFVSTWLKQGNSWLALASPFLLHFVKGSEVSRLRVSWSDVVGIYSTNWCNVGLFIDDDIKPVCVGAWSGSPGTTVFSQENIACIVDGVPAGNHVLQFKHRSQYCVYGNYAFDDDGLNRVIAVEELN